MMGMHFGLVAVKSSAKEFVAVIPQLWPAREISASADTFSTREDVWAWMKQNERFVSAAKWAKENPGTQCALVCQHGEWALFLDPSYTLASDEAALKKLSQSQGVVLSFVVESAGGCAFFWCYEAGEIRRSIQNAGEGIQLSGTPLPEEEGVDVEQYYMAETDALMEALGLPLIEDLPSPESTIALALTDRTDYGALKEKRAAAAKEEVQDVVPPSAQASELSGKSKPWWKLW